MDSYRIREETELEKLEKRVSRLETDVLFYANAEHLAPQDARVGGEEREVGDGPGHGREHLRADLAGSVTERSASMKTGDRVIDAQADDPRGCIPAMSVMFGTIVPSPYGKAGSSLHTTEGVVFVQWDCNKGRGPDLVPRSFVRLIGAEEEAQRRTAFATRPR